MSIPLSIKKDSNIILEPNQPIVFSAEGEEFIIDRSEINKKSKYFEKLIAQFTPDQVFFFFIKPKRKFA